MEIVKASAAGLGSIRDLKPLLTVKGPCLSIYMPLAASVAGQSATVNALHWREIIGELGKQVELWGAEGRELLSSVTNLQPLLNEGSGKSIAVLRSPDVFRVVFLQETVARKAVFSSGFYIRPLLCELTTGKSFHLLALSQNDVRLLHCTLTTSEEVPIGRGVITSYDDYMNSAKPDHSRVNGSSAGSAGGSARTVIGTTSSERETKEQYLTHFYKQIDKGVVEVLRGNHDPLITAGVDYERSLYKTINSHPLLLDGGVQGAPNGLKAGEMHARALQTLKRAYAEKIDDVLAEYDHKVGGGASNRLKDVLAAAHDGRVLTLVISESLTTTGSFDEATHSTNGHPTGTVNDRDLVNEAAVQTILHAGNVLVAPNAKMPHGSPVAAIFRY